MAKKALNLNGCLPEQLFAVDAEKSTLIPLRVILKTEWIEWKKKFKEIARNLKHALKPPSLQNIDPNSAHVLNHGSVLKFQFVDR